MSKHTHHRHPLRFSIQLQCITVSLLSIVCLLVDSRTHESDIGVLKDLKSRLNPESISPGSCLSSWDFKLDPCDNIFSYKFTCGFRCDKLVSGLTRVTEITLDPVGYSGSLNNFTWNLPYLHTLDISDNNFSDSIPDSISKLTRLQRLCLSKNSFSGQIPASLGSLTQLQELYLDTNSFTGPLPSSFTKLVNLQRLEIQQNSISGPFPNLGSLKNLNFLDASDNNISGEIPPSNLPNSLIELSIRNTHLQGNLPNIKNMKLLQVVDLSHNMLSGVLFSGFFQHQSLQQLTLSHNNLSSLQAPSDEKCLTSKLVAVDLSHNMLHGLLPGFFASMPNLSALSLEQNRFTGMIPERYAIKAAASPGSDTDTSSFERLLLGGNYLFGPIPSPLMDMKPGSANVSLVDNCLFRCPVVLFFCQGKNQKSVVDCKNHH